MTSFPPSVQYKLGKKVKITSARILDGFARKFNTDELSSQDAVDRMKKRLLMRRRISNEGRPIADWKVVAQQWYGYKALDSNSKRA